MNLARYEHSTHELLYSTLHLRVSKNHPAWLHFLWFFSTRAPQPRRVPVRPGGGACRLCRAPGCKEWYGFRVKSA